jgi:hypothetical protein
MISTEMGGIYIYDISLAEKPKILQHYQTIAKAKFDAFTSMRTEIICLLRVTIMAKSMY